MRPRPAIACITLAVLVASVPALAGNPSTTRQAANDSPYKDCTRFNGRVGYYANPWCTPAEQARWDRWQGSRTLKR